LRKARKKENKNTFSLFSFRLFRVRRGQSDKPVKENFRVSLIKPFRALRPVREKAEQVSCVPYDVINHAELSRMIENNPLSFLRVTRAEAELSEMQESEQSFALARQNLQKLIDEKVFLQDDEPAIYVYRLTDGAQRQTGVVACCSLDEYDAGLIKKHEKTREDKVQDRTEHMLALRAQTGLIFLTFRGTRAISKLIAETVREEPLYDFGCPQGVCNTIWKVPSAALTADFVTAFAEVPALYVADGHHRAEAASRARQMLRAENPAHAGAEDYNFVMAGIFPAEDLQILPYNRVVRDLNGLTEEEFLQKLRENFIVAETENPSPQNRNEFCVYLNGKWRKLVFNVAFFHALDPIDALDVSILQNYILKPILGIEDVRIDKRIDFIGGIRGTKELERLVDAGEFQIAFSMFPTTVEDLFQVSDADEIMPPKSTWFEPKLRDGLLVHLI
jgi:uncharacterized protein (DUF1015 family)